MKSPALRAILERVLLLVGTLLLLAIGAELALRYGLPLVKPRFTRVDPDLGWHHNSSVGMHGEREGHAFYLSYNNHGFRPPDRSFEKPSDQRRIVVLGDSFVDGAEVGDDEVFTWKLNERLDGFEVINLGVYGYSTSQELVMLQKYGLKYDPDMVLLVTLPNDFVGNYTTIGDFGPTPTFVLKDGEIQFRATDHPHTRAQFRATHLPIPGAPYLHQNSHLYYALNHYIYQRLNSDSIVRLRNAERESVEVEARATIYQAIVNRMNELCVANDVPFAVLMIYDEQQLVRNKISPNLELAEALRQDGIDVIDLFDDLKSAQASGADSLYYEEDIHWNATGHAEVARILESRLPEIWPSELGKLSATESAAKTRIFTTPSGDLGDHERLLVRRQPSPQKGAQGPSESIRLSGERRQPSAIESSHLIRPRTRGSG